MVRPRRLSGRTITPVGLVGVSLLASSFGLADVAVADYREGRQTVGNRLLSVGFDSDDGSVNVGLEPAAGPSYLTTPLTDEEWVDITLRTDCENAVPGIETWDVVIHRGSAMLDPGEDVDWTLETDAEINLGALAVDFRSDRMPIASWRCAIGKVNETPFTLYFDGYFAFSPEIATDAMIDDQSTKYSADVMDRLVYAKCPAMQFLASDSATAYCQYQLGRGRTVRAGSYLVKMPKGYGSPVARRSYGMRYSQRLVDCPSKYERFIASFNGAVGDRSTAHRLRAPRAMCGASYLWDVPGSAARAATRGKRTFIGWTHGTNAGGFDDMNIFQCRFRARRVAGGARRYRVRCANKVGDRSTYTFTIRAKRPARPERSSGGGSGGGGGGSGGAGGQYAGKTCDEIGHSYTVPPGADREHDADGDGVACESQG